SMALLAQTLALLAVTLTTMANKVKRLDMAEDSFDDQYQGCRPAMTAALPALKRSELQLNPAFAKAWAEATGRWQKRRSTDSPLSPAQATAVIAFATDGLHQEFNAAVGAAGRSPREYRDNFHFKTLHFLLTDALAALRADLGGTCQDTFHRLCGVQFVAQQGDTVRFDRFLSVPRSGGPDSCPGKGSLLRVYTCRGVDVTFFTTDLPKGGVVIPPFETFKVVQVTQHGDTAVMQLRSAGTSSNHNCEWLKGDSAGDSLG
ncbi:NAR1 ribosyltransferase, partial [Rhadina sibilatrix]|nr:NAR1 ribosyltransferase [Rhadina sibilatrix]